MKVGRLAVLAVLGVATSASAIVISGGPAVAPPGGGGCSVTTQATCNGLGCNAPDGAGGVTITCSSLNVAFYRHLYYGINNSPSTGNGPNGDSMQGAAPSGAEVFRFSSVTGSNQINYSGTTSINNARTNTISSVSETNVLVFQAGSGSLVTDGAVAALNNSNGDVQYLWQVGSNSFTTTVNVKAGGGNAIPTVFDPTATTNGAQEIDHVNLAFYWDTCGNGVREGAEQCDDGANNGTAGDCCDANCQLLPSTATCRPAAGGCDVAENCTGTSSTCPADALASSTFTCRGAAGVCDTAEKCTGTSPTCPADAFLSSTVVCRGSAGVCDVPENCTGTSASCPADAFTSSTVVCRASAGACDVAENCTGAGAACPADTLAASTVTCRGSAGVCDVAESCTGTSAACPADAFSASTVVCRASAGACDVAESCTGTSAACPPDSVQGAFVQCRAAAGDCDVAESCDGSSTVCPPDQKSTAVCRGAAGLCDVAESCDGSSNTCPPDALQPVGTTCRPAASACDVAEICTGTSAACPSDGFAPDASPCDDGNACTGNDMCQSMVCEGTPQPNGCADHYLCYKAKLAGFEELSSVHLVDDFEDVLVAVKKARSICTPADQDTQGVSDGSTHLETYSIREPASSPAHVRTTTDQWGSLSLTTGKADLLLVPTAKSVSGPVSAPDENAIAVNHYKCYRAKVTPGTLKFQQRSASIEDQFNTPLPKGFVVQKPRHLCNPVSKNSEVVKDQNAHLVCYVVKGSKGQPKHVQTNVYLHNQFDAETGKTIKESELCVPAVSTP